MKDGGFESEKETIASEPSVLVRQFYTLAPEGRALDFNSGSGSNSVFLAQHGFEVVALNRVQENLEKAIRLAAKKNVSIDFRNEDPSEFKIRRSHFSLMMANHVLQDVRKSALPEFAQNIVKGLKKGGILIGSALSINDPAYKELRKKRVSEIEINCFMLSNGWVYTFFEGREILSLFPDLQILHYAETDFYKSGGWRGLIEFVFKKNN